MGGLADTSWSMVIVLSWLQRWPMPLRWRCAFNEGEEEIELGAPGWIRQQSVCVRMCAYVLCVCVCVCVSGMQRKKEKAKMKVNSINM